MRRSLLFIPANSPAMLQNADIFQSDGVIFDLEDAVMLSEKDAAVHLLDNFLKSYDFENLEIVVRINPLDSEFSKNELEQIISDQIDTIMLPKATSKNTLALSKILDKMEKTKKISKKITIIPIIELASSVLEVKDIAGINRVSGLLLGGEDLSTDLEVERSEDGIELLLSRSLVVMAAKANKLDAIDTPYTKTNDDEGLNKDSSFAKRLGMNAKVCIHPNQIETVNTVFSPSIQDIEYARKVVMAETEALKTGRGAFTVDGKMVDKPIIERAKKLLDKAQKWGLL